MDSISVTKNDTTQDQVPDYSEEPLTGETTLEIPGTLPDDSEYNAVERNFGKILVAVAVIYLFFTYFDFVKYI